MLNTVFVQHVPRELKSEGRFNSFRLASAHQRRNVVADSFLIYSLQYLYVLGQDVVHLYK